MLCFGCGGGDSSISPFWGENGIASTDLNGDGRSDIVAVRVYISGPPPHPGYITVFLQSSESRFPSSTDYPVGNHPWNLSLGAIDGDARPDIVVANINSGTVSILVQDPFHPGHFGSTLNVTVGGKPYAVAIADFNQDGRNDLAVALQNTGGGAAVLIQDPAASLSFGAPRLLTNDTGATAVTAGDLNQDGRPDIVVTGANLDVFFQRSDGGFDSALELAAGARPSAVLIHDFDGDGFNDLLAVNAGEMDDGSGSAVSCWKQDPTHPGQFPTKQVYPVPNGGRDLALLPATNGPDPDFAVVSIVYGSQSPSSVTIFRNQGGGNFAAGQIFDLVLSSGVSLPRVTSIRMGWWM